MKLSRRSLADQMAEALIDLILDRGLREGDAMPSTGELAEDFGVSRTVVREAMADLAGRGILSRSQGRECVVTTPGAGQLQGLLAFHVRGEDLMAVQEFREALEVTTARLAAQRRRKAHLERMTDHVASMASAPDDQTFHDADVAFHRTVAEAAGNALLLLALDSVAPLLREHRIRATAGRRAQRKSFAPIVAAHRTVLERIEARDPDGAARAMSAHLAQSREGLVASRRRSRAG